MTDPLPSPPPVSAPITYRPISGLAIAGFTLACGFALMVLVMGAIALVQGAPFFYPLLVLLLPATALVLSLLARGQIRGSEGTRAGESLARAGIWISVLTGLGYVVYYGVTAMAVTTQANAFLTQLGPDSGFFPHLAKASASRAELNAAFMLTIPANMRQNVRPDDEAGMQRTYDTIGGDGAPGPLSTFRNKPIARLFTTTPPGEIKIEPLGIQGWDYEKRSYRVRRNYRVTTPEAVIEYSVPVRTTEGEAVGDARKWYVEVLAMSPKPTAVKLTDLGKGLAVLRHHSGEALERWRGTLESGTPFAFAEVDRTQWERVLAEPEKRGYVQGRVEDLFKSKAAGRFEGLKIPHDEDLGNWKIEADGRVRFDYAFRLMLEPRGNQPAYGLEGHIAVETKAAVDPSALASVEDAAAMRDVVIPVWVVRSITVEQAAPLIGKKGPPSKR